LRPCGETQQEGFACTSEGTLCDPGDSCNANLVCATTDPTLVGCPRSRRHLKKNIRYLSDADIEAAYREIMSLRLASYRYRADDRRRRLGFIMEDMEPSLAVDSERGIVDLYAYTSLAVAALKAQDRRITELERGQGSTP
jgi:hypothetical protein